MKLVLHCSNTSNAAATAVIDAIRKQNTLGSQHIFIVPDRFSLSFEREIFEQLSLPGAANIDVVSFMRLAIRELKGKIRGTLTKQGAVLVFKRAIDKNKDKLVRYSRAARSMSFAKEMFAVIASVRNGGYAPEDLLAAREHLQGGTGSKTQDIALLYDAYLKELEDGYEDATSRLEKLASVIEDSQWIKGSCVYIAGFHSFTAKEYAVIEKLIKTAKSVDIALTPTNKRANADRYPSVVLDRLKAIGKDAGAPHEVRDYQVKIPKPFDVLNGELFTYSAAQVKENIDRVRLYKENTVYEEANGVAREILRLVRNGFRFKDIAIVNASPAYQDIFASIFVRYDIPFFIDRKYNLKSTPAASFVISAAEVLVFNYRQDKVLQFAKNPLFGLSPKESDLFENYILKYNINYNGFSSPFIFDENAEIVRKKLVSSLKAIAKNTYADFAGSLDNLLDEAEPNFKAYLEAIEGEETLYASNSLSLDKVREILGEIKELLGERESRLDEQLDTLKSSIAASEISIIPQFADGVFIGNLRESRYENLKAVFVVSASAGMLPSEQGFRAIISAADSDILEGEGIRLYPTPLDLIREEEFLILDLLTKAENFYIGYSAFTPKGEVSLPSYVIKELSAILGKVPTSINNRYELTGLREEKELVYGAASYKNAYFQYLSYAKRIPKSDNFRIKLLSSLYATLSELEQAKADRLIFEKQDDYVPPANLYFKTDSNGAYLTSVSQIERYFICPYRHHLGYGIALKEREIGQLRAMDIGIIVHKALELYFKATLGKLRELTAEQLAEIAAASIKR
ncbi:MAG: PD-(D/E)XK nuclease family protein, partial [Clostridia bacterium]